MRNPRGAPGFSTLELVVTLAVIAALLAALLDRASFYRQQAEDIVFRATLINMRTGLKVEAARLLATSDKTGFFGLEGVNPITFLQSPPSNYGGVMRDADAEKLPRSYWYFSSDTKNLVYLLNSGNFVALEGQKSLNFKVKLLRRYKDSVVALDELSSYTAVLMDVGDN